MRLLLVELRLLFVNLRLLLVNLRLLLVNLRLLLVELRLAFVQQRFLLGQFLVTLKNLEVTPLDFREDFVLQVHLAAELIVGGSTRQPQQDALQVGVVGIVGSLVNMQQLSIAAVLVRLVEDAQYAVQPGVHLSPQ